MTRVPTNWAARTGWPLLRLGRRRYLVFAAALLVLTLLLPFQFIFVGGPAGWMLLWTARGRDIGRPAWGLVGLAIAAAEIFGAPVFRYLVVHLGRETTGWVVVGLLAIHLTFAIAIGVPASRAPAGVSLASGS